MTGCPQMVLGVEIETPSGVVSGYSGDGLPPGWFDKSPKSYPQQIDEIVEIVQSAEQVFSEVFTTARPFFDGWTEAYREVHAIAAEKKFPELVATFGVSFLERALIDAIGRGTKQSFWNGLKSNLWGLEPAMIHQELKGFEIKNWIADSPASSIWVRQTVGFGDPISSVDLSRDQKIKDGLPETLEEYLRDKGVRYLKLKITNDPSLNRDRLMAISDLAKRYCGDDFFVTMDGNELFDSGPELESFYDLMNCNEPLRFLWQRTLLVEQPLRRDIALSDINADLIRKLSQIKPLIIDESDSTLETYRKAIEIGYRGTTSKNCKGPIKSICHAGLNWLHNQTSPEQRLILTGEDLGSVGVLPVQQDTCLVTALGLSHVERNGHHYFPGISYLSAGEQEQVIENHSDFYVRKGQLIVPRLQEGQLSTGTLQCAGYGANFEPDFDKMDTAEQWNSEVYAE